MIRTTEEISATCLLYLPSYFTKSDTARVAASLLFFDSPALTLAYIGNAMGD